VMEPVGVEAYVGYADEASESFCFAGLVEGFSFDDFFYWVLRLSARRSVSRVVFHMGTRKTM